MSTTRQSHGEQANVGSSANKVTFTPAAFNLALSHWPRWATAELQAQRITEEQHNLISMFAPIANTYNCVTIGDSLKYWTSGMATKKKGRGCHWVVLHKALAPKEFAERGRPLFGRISTIWEHQTNALGQEEADGPAVLLAVDWFVAPSQLPVYDKELHVAVIGKAPSKARKLPPGIMTAGQVVPIDLVIAPHPKANNLQVVLPVNNDFYWLTALGYDGPNL